MAEVKKLSDIILELLNVLNENGDLKVDCIETIGADHCFGLTSDHKAQLVRIPRLKEGA